MVMSNPGTAIQVLAGTDKYSDVGVYSFSFYKQSMMEEVVIDDRIPSHVKTGPRFGTSGLSDELWVCLLEKAYAKLHGSYSSLSAGHVVDALVDLTDGVPEAVPWSDLDHSQLNGGALWSTMWEFFASAGGLMGASAGSAGVAQGGGPGQPRILPGRVYPVLEARIRASDGLRLLRIANTWGPQGAWQGPWSNIDKEAWTKDACAELDFDPAKVGHTQFWMTYEDFIKSFNKIHVCRLFDDSWFSATFDGSWAGKTAGGSPSNPSWISNPQYLLTVYEKTNLWISLAQPDARLKGTENLFMGFTVFVSAAGTVKATSYRPFVETKLSNARETAKKVELLPGYYLIMPFTMDPGDESDFTIRFFASHPILVESLDGTAARRADPPPSREAPPKDSTLVVLPKAKIPKFYQYRAVPDDSGLVSTAVLELRRASAPKYNVAEAGKRRRTRKRGPGQPSQSSGPSLFACLGGGLEEVYSENRFFVGVIVYEISAGGSLPPGAKAKYSLAVRPPGWRKSTTRFPCAGNLMLGVGERWVAHAKHKGYLVYGEMVDRRKTPVWTINLKLHQTVKGRSSVVFNASVSTKLQGRQAERERLQAQLEQAAAAEDAEAEAAAAAEAAEAAKPKIPKTMEAYLSEMAPEAPPPPGGRTRAASALPTPPDPVTSGTRALEPEVVTYLSDPASQASLKFKLVMESRPEW